MSYWAVKGGKTIAGHEQSAVRPEREGRGPKEAIESGAVWYTGECGGG